MRQELLQHEAYLDRSHVDHFGRTVHGLLRQEGAAVPKQAPKQAGPRGLGCWGMEKNQRYDGRMWGESEREIGR